ncbi:MAG: lipid A biosynthesis acyltransferase [Candidatus Thiodiazotropha lotti]|uniref:Lipid A biosynthesis acyltransferase n=1 Tax=Candidatus Thiodiazotropha endoloripes TaxID=1818881 RepID=A0A1E2UR96_9GAMM|nr:lipid A biosynthesis acyltransferase [Candidatus Thiodiazotropha endoloripes]MCG7900739.1 lipid A biosynthesis acyltransferase [Candidatus Thiodiazotropha weberae]MCG7990107.1 lipid A biosynthesis acyltransferase [Candidatus Thiodiazotropha lotti]MCG7903446.1 lipid A biosynthesis acyltransferase [Candidatus Thiodiazotropha weberae]MCG7915560.1 lipid A biosynthesis acyltransferase [Candidatus Thiodiazotropha weberae]MCG8000562.1 lipid A biosynthesis acyltransferase [Candidatus Thiodiazotroph
MSRRWQGQVERGTTGALHLILWIALNLGRFTARLILYPITLYFLITGSTQRRASTDYLNLTLDRPANLLDNAKHIHTFSATILDRVFLMADRYDYFDLEIHNHKLIAQHLDANQGCILLGSHLGSFEILRATAITKRELPLKILMYPQHNEMMMQVFSELNPSLVDSIIELGRPDTLIKAQEVVDQGGILGLLGDRVTDPNKTVQCQFLGRETTFPQGPMLLASIMKCPVFLFFGLYLGGNRYQIRMEHFTDRVELERGRREEMLQSWTQRYADRLEHYARHAPYNWFNFYDFWGRDDASE